MAGNQGADIRSVRRELLSAGDQQVQRVVAMVDQLPERGAADALIAPLRPRLALLRLHRPLNFTRLLFAPLDPLIVPQPAWRPGSPAIPRPALGPLGATVQATLGKLASEFEVMIAGRSTADAGVVAAAGAALWPAAASALRTAPAPADWVAATGLPQTVHAALAPAIAALLDEGSVLHRLSLAEVETGLQEPERLLRAAAADPLGFAMMLALLLGLLPQAKGLVLLADDLAARRTDEGRAAPERALDFLLDGVGSGVEAAGSVVQTADLARRAALLLEEVEAGAAATKRTARQTRVTAVRRQLDAVCRERFGSAAGLVLPASGSPAAAATELVDDAGMAAAEGGARDLRRLDAVGRRLGDAGLYDRTLRTTATRLVRDPRLTQVDRLRLVEILLGPDAALTMLGGV